MKENASGCFFSEHSVYTKKQKTHTQKYAPVALYKNKNKVQRVHNVYSNVDQM